MKASLGCVVRLSVVLVLLGCAQSLLADTVYDIVADFSTTSNPNGVWTYEYTPPQGYVDPLFSIGGSNMVGTTLPGWWNGGSVQLDNIYILQNVTGSTYDTGTVSDPTDTLWMNPAGGTVSVVFTAPSVGTYTIAGDFLGIDTTGNKHLVQILDPSTTVMSGKILNAGSDDSFNFTETLNAGDTISFEVIGPGADGTGQYLSTGLKGTITETTPEPGTLTMLGLGLLGLVPLMRRKRFTQS